MRTQGQERGGRRLAQLPVLIVDVQTTGSSPQRGALLEVGWMRWPPRAPRRAPPARPGIESRLVRLPPGAKLPPAVQRLTGITPAELEQAVERAAVWEELQAAASGTRLTLAHYARFETAFLRDLQAEAAPDEPFPWEWLCTHGIARKLLPELPRCGLRAVAGYFGTAVPELKRAASHVEATACVWQGLVTMLGRVHSIYTLDELRAFLKAPAPKRPVRWTYPLERARRLGVAACPGVYRFVGAGGRVLYVGKATSLRARVNSYYRKRRGEERHLELVSQARDLDLTETATALEAALLEADEIRRLDPPYNRALRPSEPDVWYASPDWRRVARTAGKRHPVGPLPARDALLALRTLADLLAGRRRVPARDHHVARQLGVDFRERESGALAAAVARLQEDDSWVDGARGRALTHALLDWGAGLQVELLAAREALDDEEVGPAGEAEEEAIAPPDADLSAARVVLTADDLINLLQGVILYGTRLIRHSRWLGLLADATIHWWPRPEGSRRQGRRLVLAAGEIRERDFLPAEPGGVGDRPSASTSSAPRPSRVERLARLERPAYERLRVLSGELRRLAQAERRVQVELGPGRSLDQERLARLYRMI